MAALAALRARRGDVCGVAWVLLLALLFLSPALTDGPQFAPADLGTTDSPALLRGALPLSHDCVPPPVLASCPHNSLNGDQITQAIPWSTENWRLVHAGHFPLWDDLEGNGLPQFLNFESATLALPSLVSYLFPLSLAFLVTVLVKLLIAGLGTYALCRLLGCRPLAAALGGTTYMLSGAFSGWLGWSISGTMCWAGALGATALWCYRRRGALPLAALAGAVAFAVYGGFVEAYVLLTGFFGVLLVAGGLALLARRERPQLAGAARALGGAALGVALAAPLWLCGLPVLRASVRSGEVTAHGILVRGVALFFAQGYDGLPTAGSSFFGVGLPNYYESASYVGVLALVLALLALVLGRRRPAVVAFAAAGVAGVLVAYRLDTVSPVQRLVIDLGLGAVDIDRILSLVALAVAVLAALGAEALAARARERAVRRSLAAALLVVGGVVGLLGVKALGGLAAPYLALRQASLYWPVASLVLVAVAALLLLGGRAGRRERARGGTLARLSARPGEALVALALVGQSAFLLFAGVGVNSYSRVAFPGTVATATLSRLTGGALVGLDSVNDSACYRLFPTGLYPAMNVGYDIDELAVHDPTAPKAYFDSWPVAGAGQTSGGACAKSPGAGVNLFAPPITSAALARRYGAAFILSDAPTAPSGARRVGPVGADTLYAVSASGRFSASAGATVGATSHPFDARYTLTVDGARPTTVTARITPSPGWQATSGGRPLTLGRGVGNFYTVRLPAGRHTVSFTYRPPHLVAALVLVLLALLVLAALALAAVRRRGPIGRVPVAVA